MKVKPDFELRTVAGENIIVATGKMAVNFSRLISLNDTAAYLWQEVAALPAFDENTLAQLITNRYDVDAAIALKDGSKLLQDWADAGIIEA